MERAIIIKVQRICSDRRIRIEEFMKTFDIHNTKRITKMQFRRSLDLAKIELTELELLTMENAYESENGEFSYRAFCEQVEMIFVQKGLEKNPTLNVGDALDQLKLEHANSNVKEDQVNDVEDGKYRDLVGKLAGYAKTRGIVVKDVYRDFDKMNTGIVTSGQFLRNVFASFKELKMEEAELIMKVNQVNGGGLKNKQVHYRNFHVDLVSNGQVQGMQSHVEANRPIRRTKSPLQTMAEATEDMLMEMVQRDRMRVKAFFIEHDKLRTGKCSMEQFKRCLKLCFGTILTLEQMNALVEKHKDALNMVNYGAFSDAVNPDLHYVNGSLKTEAPKLTDDKDVEILNQVMMHLHNAVTTQRVLIKPLFQDFDKRNRGTVSTEQFLRVLAMFHLMPGASREKEVLLCYYGKHEKVDYITFCQHLEDWGHASNMHENVDQNDTLVQPQHVLDKLGEPTKTFPTLIRIIKERAKRERLRIEEYFRDYDTLRKGKISQTQFSSGLSLLGFQFTPEEVNTLASNYVVQGDTDVGKSPFVAWMAFADEINSIFTQKGLEQDPLKNVPSATRAAQSIDMDEGVPLSSVEESELMTTLENIHELIARKRLYIKPLFEDFDQVRRGYIPSSKFERALSMFQLLPSSPMQVQTLIKKFSEKPSSAKYADVNYKAFLSAIDAVAHGAKTVDSAISYRRQREDAPSGIASTSKPIHSASDSSTNVLSNQMDVEEVLSKIRRIMSSKRMRLTDFLSEGDKLRTGEVSLAKFHTALNRLGIQLSKAELSALQKAFVSPKSEDRIQWRVFESAVSSSNGQHRIAPSSTQLPPRVLELVQLVKDAVSQKRLHLKPYFQDYDRNNGNKITKFQFAAVLDMMQLNLSSKDLNALTTAFSNGSVDVNYHDFVRLVDETL